MKYLYLLLSLTLAFCTLEYVSAQNEELDQFQLPNELHIKYFNISMPDIQQKCDEAGNCLGDKERVIDEVRHNAGLRMIDHISNLMSERSSVTNADWDTIIEHRCLTNIPMDILVSLSMEIGWTCVLKDMNVAPETIKEFRKTWVNEFCARVRKLSMKRYEQNKNHR